MLQFVAVWDTSVISLKSAFNIYVAVCCSVLQCVVVYCSVLQFIPVWDPSGISRRSAFNMHVAVCCSVLQCFAVCCSVLQCVAVCCSVLQYGILVEFLESQL